MKITSASARNLLPSAATLRAVFATALLVFNSSAFGLIVSLKTVPIPEALDLDNFVQDRLAAIRLGKALFWDMQLGSDGIQACASCHFHAGADRRATNQLNPGTNAGDSDLGNNELGLPEMAPGALELDQTVTATHFPFHRLANLDAQGEPANNAGNVLSDINDVMSSQGVTLMEFVDIDPGNPVDIGNPIPDPVFQVNNVNIRRVEPRHTPSVINAVFNFVSFWDGRANNIFNGNNPFGPADPRPHLISNDTGSLQSVELRLRQSALASQASGPPVSDFEMSWRGRTWPKIGKKMLSLKPLGQQQVSSADSRLGFLADTAAGAGLTTTYAAMIQAAFWPEYWNNTTEKVVYDADGNASFLPGQPANTDEYTQMEANFSFFFSMAVQLYEAILVADDSRFDRFLEGNGALTTAEQQGLTIFNGAGGCLNCHDGGETHDNGVFLLQGRDPITDIPTPLDQNPIAVNELMQIATGIALYDAGFHNSGIRPGGGSDPSAPDFLATSEDIGRGGLTGLGGTLEEFSLSFGILGLQNDGFLSPALPAFLSPYVPALPDNFLPTDTTPYPNRVANFGAFKTPGLRNIALTGPYMHNGGMSTLRQVVDFYVRGGDFSTTNQENFDTALLPIGLLRGDDALKDALVQFLMTLTDQRVSNETAPFDHPELFVPIHGEAPVSPGNRDDLVAMSTDFERIPAVGAGGRSSQGLPPLSTFLGLNPRSVAINPDADADGLADNVDNCPLDANPGQQDGDADGVGDACDACPIDPDNDVDGDGVCGDVDNCPVTANADQADTDGDGIGDACDACSLDPDNDIDGDGVCGDVDNCPVTANADQNDADGDGIGDVCDACSLDADNDADGDGVCGDVDNCPTISNSGQRDADADTVGDLCDNCIDAANTTQLDTDGDDYGNICDADFDDNQSVGLSDLSAFRTAFGQSGSNEADLDGNGSVGVSDLGIFRSLFGLPPGPSAFHPPAP
jgi:cytochrome c peroxidase